MALPLREVRRQETRRALLEAAQDVLAARGLAEARVEEIAERAGVSVGTIYNYFQDRDDLVKDLLGTRREELEKRLAGALEQSRGQSFQSRLESFARAVFEHYEQHRAFLQVSLEIEHQKSIVAFRARSTKPSTSMRAIYEAARKLVNAGIAEGVLRTDSGDRWPAILTGVVRGVLIQELHGEVRRSATENASIVARFFLEGAKA